MLCYDSTVVHWQTVSLKLLDRPVVESNYSNYKMSQTTATAQLPVNGVDTAINSTNSPSVSSSRSNTSKRTSERIASMHSTTETINSMPPSAPPPAVVSNSSTITTTVTVAPKILTPNDSADDSALRRRSSSRSIKRKKFDDELVDSMSTSYPKAIKPTKDSLDRPFNEPFFGETGGSDGGLIVPTTQDLPSTSGNDAPIPVPIPSTSRKPKVPSIAFLNLPSTSTATPSSSSSSSSHKKKKSTRQAVVTLRYSEENGYWKPIDDLALIINVEQTNDLVKVHQGVKFSCKFTYSDIEARWQSLLYDVNAKNLALAAIRQLHPDVVNLIEAKALFSEAEEALLKSIESRNEPSLDTLQQLIDSNAEIFFPSRTPKLLLKQWLLLRHYQLLSDQTLQPLPRHESVVSFSEVEMFVRKELEEELKKSACSPSSLSSNDAVNQEIMHGVRKSMLEIRMLENEIPKYQSLLDSITGIAPSDFDNQTYAVLRGRLVRYLMRSKEITIGRTTKDFTVDVDLSLEGPSTKISRLQAIISLQQTGEFIMFNSGKRPIYIDSKPLLSDTSLRVSHNSLIEFSTLKFIFLINQDLISNIRNEVLQVLK